MESMKSEDKKSTTLQAKTFGSAAPAKGAEIPEKPEIPEADKATGVGFDQVVIALKAGKVAQRVQWKGQMSLIAVKDTTGKVVDFGLKTAHSSGRAGLHNLDLLAEDWKIVEA